MSVEVMYLYKKGEIQFVIVKKGWRKVFLTMEEAKELKRSLYDGRGDKEDSQSGENRDK